MTRKAGRPSVTPKRVTVTLSQHHAAELQKLADEAEVTLSAFCAHVLERYAIQDHDLMTNDVIAQRLEKITERHEQRFAERFGEILLREAHETVALRRQFNAFVAAQLGEEAADELKEAGWQAAVKTLRPYSQKVRGEDRHEERTEGR